MIKVKIVIVAQLFVTLFISCTNKNPTPEKGVNSFNTQNVILIVMDGARFSETWGEAERKFIPRMSNALLSHGVLYNNFYNNGDTYTMPGPVAISTGVYQSIINNGTELPDSASIFQLWLKSTNNDSTSAWVITSKDKLEVLSDCLDPKFKEKYRPSTNSGIGGVGVGSGYRHDSLTYNAFEEIIVQYKPKLMLINLREPDYSAHKNDWGGYLEGIKSSDEYVFKIWNFLESINSYQDKTTYFITNDHGRHLDSVADGFVSHGDGCEGCRHISLLAIGPDFKKGIVEETKREMIDIPVTIANLLGFDMPSGQGEVMDELFDLD